MYKRKVRIIFADDGSALAIVACAYANVIGANWLEAVAVSASRPGHVARTLLQWENCEEPDYQVSLSDDTLSWADLLITIGPQATAAPALPRHVQTRHWTLTIPDSIDRHALEKLARELHGRVEGVIGGIKMLAKVDQADADAHQT